MTAIDSITIEAPDPAAATAFYDAAFGLGDRLRVRAATSPTSGFRGFTLSLIVSQPADADALLLGTTDITESKRFYVERGLSVARSFGRKYVEFDAASTGVKLALYGRKALAKDAGVPQDGDGSHRLAIGVDSGVFTDPDGFEWEGRIV